MKGNILNPTTNQPGGTSRHPSPLTSKALFLAAHLDEINTGIHPSRTHPRGEYDLRATSRSGRIQAKADELRKMGLPTSRATIYRWQRAYHDHGVAGLVDGRSKPRPARRNIDSRIVAAAITVMTTQHDVLLVPIIELIHRTLALAIQNAGEQLTWPSRRTMYRLLNALILEVRRPAEAHDAAAL